MTASGAIEVELNGETRALEGAQTLADLLGRLALEPSQVAIELNRAIVPRIAYPSTTLKQGDVIEIVTFVGGG